MIENIPGEEWKDIPGYEGIYQVSTEGRIKRLPYYKMRRNQWNSYLRHYPERLLVANPDSEGYCQVGLIDYDGIMKQFRVHRLVMEAFSPEWDPNKEVDHIFGVKHDNRLSQLRMVTTEENNYHFWNDDAFEEERQKKFYHKEFSDSTRAKISEGNRRRKGYCWVHKGSDIKFVSPEDVDKYLSDGYQRGMGQVQAENVRNRYKSHTYKYVHKGSKQKQVIVEEVDKYLSDGWLLGALTKGDK